MLSEIWSIHQRLGHINRTLHADIDKPISIAKININNLHKNKFVFMKKNYILLKKFAFDCWHNTVLWYTTNNTQHKIHSCYIISFETFMAVFGEEAVEQFVDSDRRWLLGLGLDAQSLLYIRYICNWIYDGRLSRPPSTSSKLRI